MVDEGSLEERTDALLPYLERVYRETDSFRKVANRVNSNPETIRQMLKDDHVPSDKTLGKIEEALGLARGEPLPEPSVESVKASGNKRLISWLKFLIDVLDSRDVELPLLVRMMEGREGDPPDELIGPPRDHVPAEEAETHRGQEAG